MVELITQKDLELAQLRQQAIRVRHQARRGAHVGERSHRGRRNVGARLFEQIDHHEVDHAPHGLIDQPAPGQTRPARLDHAPLGGEQRDLVELRERDQPRAQPVVHVMVVVGNLVCQVGKLRFDRGLSAVKKALADIAQALGIDARAVLEDALAGLEHQVQPIEGGIAVFEQVHRAQRLKVVFEATVILHAGVQRILPGVAERGVPEVVRERDRLRQILVEAELAGDTARDLGDFDAMGEAGAKQIALVIHEHLRLVFQAAKGGGVHDAITVALKFAARHRPRLVVSAPARVDLGNGIGSELQHRFVL